MDGQISNELIKKYLNGECNDDERRIIDDFLLQPNAQEQIDQVLEEEWADFKEKEISDDEISHWKARFLTERLREQPANDITLRPRKRLFSLPYAAVWATLLFGAGLWFAVTQLGNEKEVLPTVTLIETVNPMGKRTRIQLSDSSVIVLGAGSKLVYPERFTDSTRTVSLEGEAFFEITKNPDRPFIVQTGDVRTRVLGTSFLISSFAGQPLSVAVATGKVRVMEQRQETETALAVLTPGQNMVMENGHVTVSTVEVTDVSEWKNGRLAFNGATLREMADALERWYGVTIHFNRPATADRRMTITLTANVPLSEIMDVLAVTGRFSYSIENKQFIIN
ncbi:MULTISPECIES: FecR family protein [Sphingobacterium]|uniref:FecR family protein n=1 Tax=Sphingobacterium TaxID=28453 RepID=UPI0021A620E3|nr:MULTISPECIES: FecR domain-containing protein [Sphingobacterium]MCT1524878.1 DUF4974 domain-containing protein [Sphingobacterium hotanense]